MFASRTDADRWLAGQPVDQQRGAWVDPASGGETLAHWSAKWLATTVHVLERSQQPGPVGAWMPSEATWGGRAQPPTPEHGDRSGRALVNA